MECYKVEIQLNAVQNGVRCLDQFFTVKDPSDAIQAAVAWANNRFKALKDKYREIIAIHCWRFSVEEPQEDGFIGSRNLYSVFSWTKGLDHGTPEEKLESFHVQVVS